MRRVAAILLGLALAVPGVRLPSAALGGGASSTTARLSMIAPGLGDGTTFAGGSRDLAHVFFSTTSEIGGQSGGASRIYDAIADRFILPVQVVEPIDPSGIGLVATSADGRFLIVATYGQLLPEEDTDSLPDMYWVDGSTLTLIEPYGNPEESPEVGGGGNQPSVLISPDGSRVIFNTPRPLDATADLDNENDLYEWLPATDAWAFLTPGATWPQAVVGWTADLERVVVDVVDTLIGTQIHNNLWEVSDAGFQRVGSGAFESISDDQSRLYFSSEESFVEQDQDGLFDAYELGPDGYRLLSDPAIEDTDLAGIAADGHTWFLQSFSPLIDSDTDDSLDVYRMRTGQSPQLVTGGTEHVLQVKVSYDASTLFYRTTSAVLPADTDPAEDLYRWRAGEGTTLVTEGSGTAIVRAMDPTGTGVILESGMDFVAEDDDEDADLYRLMPDDTFVLLTPGEGDVEFRATSTDTTRVIIRGLDELLADDTNIYPDVYVSDLDVSPPTPTVSGPTTGTSTSTDYTVGSVGDDAVWLDCQIDGGAWTKCEGTNALDGLSLGTHTIAVDAWDAAGNGSTAPATLTWEIVAPESVPPTATPPVRALIAGSGISGGKVPVKLAWTGSDVGSGIARYVLQQRTDDGAWTTISSSSAATTATRSLAPKHGYAFRVRAFDKAGNASAWAASRTFELSSYQQSSTKVTYRGSWSTATGAEFWGGSARRSSTEGSRATFTATGRSIGFIARRGPNRGKAAIFVDGVKVATVDLYSATYQNQQVVWIGSWASSRSRSIKVRVLGTNGRPRVDVDAFVVIR